MCFFEVPGGSEPEGKRKNKQEAASAFPWVTLPSRGGLLQTPPALADARAFAGLLPGERRMRTWCSWIWIPGEAEVGVAWAAQGRRPAPAPFSSCSRQARCCRDGTDYEGCSRVPGRTPHFQSLSIPTARAEFVILGAADTQGQTIPRDGGLSHALWGV